MIETAQAPAAGQAPNDAELARQVDAEIRAAMEVARQDMEAVRQDVAGARAQGAPPPPPPPAPGGSFRVEEGGRIVQIGPEGVKVLPAQTGEAVAEPIPAIPPEAVVISLAFFVMVAVILIGWPIARAFARRMDRASVATPRSAAGDPERLVRIEQAIEAMAVEVERISENQRFVTKLLADGRQGREAIPASGAATPVGSARAAAAPAEGERR